jgi:excisionase family DNA binding protein
MSESRSVGRLGPRTNATDPPANPDRSQTSSRGLWTMNETAQWLNVPERMVRRLVTERRIPFVKVGRYVRFRPEDVEGWRDGNVRPAMVVTRQTLTG